MPDRPNLVFIFSDRQRFDTLKCYGNGWIQTPRLNALAEESFVFEHAYVTQAVCAPARSSIMTGLFPHATGVPVNKRVMQPHLRTIANLTPDDYRKAYFGKWHLGDETVRQRGFDEWVSVMDTLYDDVSKHEYRCHVSDYTHFLLDHGLEPDRDAPGGRYFSAQLRAGLPTELQMATFLANRAARFIDDNKDRPFILFVSFLEPHPPFTGPYDHVHDPATMPVDPSFLQPPEGHSLFSRLRSELFMNCVRDGHDLTTEAGWRQLRSNYMGNITLVDDAVGKIVNAIGEAGVSDQTAVVYTSEHGDLVGSHAMLEMRTFYEPAAKVPLLVRAPWLGAPRRIEGHFSQIDLLPTLLDLLGEAIPRGLHGESRASVFEAQASLEGNDVFIEHNGIGDRDLSAEAITEHRMSPERVRELNLMNTLPWRSVVTADRWKLNLCAGDQCELFDLTSDPHELANLFNAPEHRDRIRHMAARIRLWQHRTGDTAPLPDV